MAKKTNSSTGTFNPFHLKVTSPADSLLSDISVNGTFSGLSFIMPNPDPILKKLGWNKDIEAYQEILADPQLYGAIENNRKPGVKSLLRYLDNEKCPANEVEFFQKYFEALDRDNTYDNITSQTLDTPQFGRMVFGLVWDNLEGYFLPKKILALPHKMCKFDTNGDVLIQDALGSFSKPDHPARYIVLQHKPTPDNPYGEALLSRCYWNVKFKREAFKLWAIFVEKYGMPWVKAKYNSNQLENTFKMPVDSAAQLLLDHLSNMAREGVIVYPDGVEMDLTNGGNATSIEIFNKLVRICDEQNTKLQLGHSGATESTSGDKLSNDTTATEVRQHIVESDKKFPIMFWNKIIYWIHQFNFSGTEMPIFDLYAKEDVDMQIAERDAKLAPVLMQSGLKLSKEYLIKTYGFVEEDIEDLSVPVQPENGTQKNLQTQNGTQNMSFINLDTFHAKADDKFEDQELIDEQIEKAVENSASTESMIADVIAMVNNADKLEDIKDDIAKMFKKVKSEGFEEDLVNLLFAAELVGHFAAKSETE